MRRYLAYVNDVKEKRLTHVKCFLTAMGRLHTEEVVVACIISDHVLFPAHVCVYIEALTRRCAVPPPLSYLMSYLMVFKSLYLLLQIAIAPPPVLHPLRRMLKTSLLTCWARGIEA